jgi:hypothetical protein
VESTRVDLLLQELMQDHEHLLAFKPARFVLVECVSLSVDAPEAMVRIVIANLLRNAAENTQKGDVTVSLTRAQAAGDGLRRGLRRGGGRAQLQRGLADVDEARRRPGAGAVFDEADLRALQMVAGDFVGGEQRLGGGDPLLAFSFWFQALTDPRNASG